jgi:hypothetical protein
MPKESVMLSLGLLILWSAAGERQQVPVFSEDDRADVEEWAKARGYRLEPVAARDSDGDLQNV